MVSLSIWASSSFRVAAEKVDAPGLLSLWAPSWPDARVCGIDVS